MMDAINIPSTLTFDVPFVPPAIVDKALWYVMNRATHIHQFRDADGSLSFYILRKDNPRFKKIDSRLIEMYEAAARGERDHRIKDLDKLSDVCLSLHLVCEADARFPVPFCELNPGDFDCVHCKGFKGHGICSHVLAVNHIRQEVNLRREVMEIGQKYKKRGPKPGKAKAGPGRKQKPKPALQKQREQADTSDEELERLIMEGEEGR